AGGLVDGGRQGKESPPVREGIGGDIEDAHDARGAQIERAPVAIQHGPWTSDRHEDYDVSGRWQGVRSPVPALRRSTEHRRHRTWGHRGYRSNPAAAAAAGRS